MAGPKILSFSHFGPITKWNYTIQPCDHVEFIRDGPNFMMFVKFNDFLAPPTKS